MKFNRPKYLPGLTLKILLGNHVYLTVSYDEYGIVELFSQAGKVKSDSKEAAELDADLRAHSEAISRLVSRALQQARTVEDRTDILKTLAKTLRGIQGHSSGYNTNGVFLHSLPDAIGWVLQGCPDRESKPTLDVINYPGPKMEAEDDKP